MQQIQEAKCQLNFQITMLIVFTKFGYVLMIETFYRKKVSRYNFDCKTNQQATKHPEKMIITINHMNGSSLHA